MSILEIIPLIGVGIGTLLSIASVLLPIFLKQKTPSSLSRQFQETSIPNTPPSISLGEDFFVHRTSQATSNEDLLLGQADQMVEQAEREKEKGQKSQEEALKIFVAHR